MKVPCPLCEKKVPRKRLEIVQGLFVCGRIARVCQECFSMSDEEHRKLYEDECKRFEEELGGK
jgi:hypothetical protein